MKNNELAAGKLLIKIICERYSSYCPLHFSFLKILFCFSFFILHPSFFIMGHAQPVFSLDSAIAITLKNNYNILLAKNAYKASSNSYAPGEAGMLPNISANASYSMSVSSINQKYSSGLEISKNGAITSTVAPYVELSWTLFDGAKMFAAYKQLGLMKDEGLENLKAAIQDNIASVIEAYYNIVMQKQLLAVDDSNLAVYKEEMDIAQKQYSVGMGSKLNYLQAEVSYNAQYTTYIKQEVTLSNAIISLNQVLELPVETTYAVVEDINIANELRFDSLKILVMKQNPSLILGKTAIDVARMNVKEANALRLPSVGLGLNFGLSHNQSNAGFALYNQSYGLLSGGLVFSWTIFNGSIITIQRENAQLAELNSKFQYELTGIQVSAALLGNFRQYEINLKILKLDEENFKVAKENVSIALQQFKIGTTNIVQLQQAQASYAAAGSQVVTDRYNAKMSETQLLQLSGQLAR